MSLETPALQAGEEKAYPSACCKMKQCFQDMPCTVDAIVKIRDPTAL